MVTVETIDLCENCHYNEWETKVEDENDNKIFVCGDCFIILTQGM